MKQITSASNPLIKKILLLQEKSKLRKEEKLFVIDGWKETLLAIENGFEVTTITYRKGVVLDSSPLSNIEIVELSEDVFDKISYRESTSKVVAIAKPKKNSLTSLSLTEIPLIIILDGIEKPGNVGAILRIADAANIDAVICCDITTDIYNPNVIRSSVGCLFSRQIAVASKEDTLKFMKDNKINIYTTSLKAAKNYLDCDYKNASAFVFGTEATGVDEFWENHSTENIIIPMRGQNDSLNVSNSVSILLFEALRQRT